MSASLVRRALPPRAAAGTLAVSSLSSSSSADDEESAVSAAVSVLIHQRSKPRWSSLRSLFPHGFTPTQISEILLKVRNNPILSHSFFNFAVRNYSLSSPLPLHCYASIIHVLARARLKTRALALIKEAVRTSELEGSDDLRDSAPKRPKIFKELVRTYRVYDSSPLVFDLLIGALVESNKLDPCIEILRLLWSGGFRPHDKTCNRLISAALRQKGCEFGYDLYREIFVFNDNGDDNNVKRDGNHKLAPNVHTFNELMLAFHRDGSIEMVEKIWIEMARLNCTPNIYSYSILMATYCEDDAMEKARNAWEDLKVKGLRPDVAAYNTLIGGYSGIGEIEKAEELYREMEFSDLKGSSITYQHLINGYCLRGDADSAMLVYKDMCSKGFSLDTSTLNNIVRVVMVEKSVSDAFDFFGKIMETADFVASETSYQLLIKGLCSEGRMDEALKLQAQMVGNGFKPDSDIYGAFIDGYMRQGKPNLVEKLREEMMASQEAQRDQTRGLDEGVSLCPSRSSVALFTVPGVA